jgi:cytochrome c
MRGRVLAWFAAVLMACGRVDGAHAEDGDAARGQRVFQYCYACHSVDPNEKAQLQGPTLYHIIGRPAASLTGFDYSDAMKTRAATGLTWDAATLDAYVADPPAIVPGTRMSAPPLRDAQDRADLIAYLARSGPYQP